MREKKEKEERKRKRKEIGKRKGNKGNDRCRKISSRSPGHADTNNRKQLERRSGWRDGRRAANTERGARGRPHYKCQ